jgi:hypothetical protein
VSATGCGADTLASSVREVVLGAVPELVDVEATRAPPVTSAFIPLDSVRRRTP